jgi:acetyl esterase/lipase
MERASAGRVSVEPGVVCGSGGDRELRCDVFTPPAGTANGVGVLLVHGGGWARGERSQLRGYGILLGRLGYTCVACEYRLAGEAKWPAQLHDVKAALRWMRANSGQLGIEPAKIAVSGNSAGGHLSLMLAATPNHDEFEGSGGHAGAGTEVAASIAFYAPTNLGVPHQAADRRNPGATEDAAPELPDAIAFLFGPDASSARRRSASPITYAAPAFPPTLLITGNHDVVVPSDESVRMYRALVTAGARAELHVYDGAPHAFDALPDFGRQCASIMALFLDRHVANPRTIAMPSSAEPR